MRELGIGAAVLAVVALLGSGVQDWWTSTPQVVDVLVLDKVYREAYTTTSCSGKPMTCSTTHHPPEWRIEYADEARHWTTVSQGTFEVLRVGDKKVLRYNLGGGYWRARYSEQFQLVALPAEGSWPTR